MKELILNYWYVPIVFGLLFIFGLIIKGFINASRNPMPETDENGDRIMTELRAKYKDYDMTRDEMKDCSQHLDKEVKFSDRNNMDKEIDLTYFNYPQF